MSEYLKRLIIEQAVSIMYSGYNPGFGYKIHLKLTPNFSNICRRAKLVLFQSSPLVTIPEFVSPRLLILFWRKLMETGK